MRRNTETRNKVLTIYMIFTILPLTEILPIMHESIYKEFKSKDPRQHYVIRLNHTENNKFYMYHGKSNLEFLSKAPIRLYTYLQHKIQYRRQAGQQKYRGSEELVTR